MHPGRSVRTCAGMNRYSCFNLAGIFTPPAGADTPSTPPVPAPAPASPSGVSLTEPSEEERSKRNASLPATFSSSSNDF